jgi:Rrf2 family protein
LTGLFCFGSIIIPTKLVGFKYMMFTTKTEYGMRAMVALVKADKNNPLSLAQIAKEEHISQAYLERLFKKLKADDLVKSVSGAGGGYYLSRNPKSINMFEIVEALDGPLSVFYCMSSEQRKMVCTPAKCLTKQVWHELQKNVVHTLRSFTLADLV